MLIVPSKKPIKNNIAHLKKTQKNEINRGSNLLEVMGFETIESNEGLKPLEVVGFETPKNSRSLKFLKVMRFLTPESSRGVSRTARKSLIFQKKISWV